MASLRARARRLAFGAPADSLSDASSTIGSLGSDSKSTFSLDQNMIRQSSSISTQNCHCQHSGFEKAAHRANRHTKRVQRIHRSQTFERFVEALEQDGCVVVQDFVSPQISQRVQVGEAVNQKLEAGQEEGEEQWDDDSTSVDINAMIRSSLHSDSLFQTLSSHFLSLETLSWQDKQLTMRMSKPRLSSSSTHQLNATSAPSGASTTSKRLAFHRSDTPYHTRHQSTIRYDYQSRRDVSVGLIVPELDALSASVRIETVPGSHLWDDQKPDVAKGVKAVELTAGEALILLGSLYWRIADVNMPDDHESPSNPDRSVNVHSVPREKVMHEIWTCSGIYRPAAGMDTEEEYDNELDV